MMESFSFSELNRRVANLMRMGKICEVKDTLVKVQIGKVTSNWLQVLGTAGDTNVWIPPTIGELVLVLSPYGEMSQAVALRSVHYNDFPKPAEGENETIITFKDGSRISYNPDIQELNISVGLSKITVSESEISLRVGAVSITISETGVTIVPPLSGGL